MPRVLSDRPNAAFPCRAHSANVSCRCRLHVVPTDSEEDLAERPEETEILLVVSRKVDARLLAIVPRVRFVQRVGVGYDNLDLDALQAARVVAAYTPGANAVAVAEHTILLMLVLLKRFAAAESLHDRAAGQP